MIKPITALTEQELNGKKVLLRVDFNLPVAEGKISEFYRVDAAKETIDFLSSRGAIVGILSHITAVKSFEPIFEQIKTRLAPEIKFISGAAIGGEVAANLGAAAPGDVFMLENVRQHEGEEKNDEDFAKKLAANFDIYVNDAFAACHRAHASLTSIAKFLPAYGGPLLMKEIENLARAIETPREGKTLILGGAKVESKLPVIENFLYRAENILIGGVVANVFLKAKGVDIGKSLVDDNFLPKAKQLMEAKSDLGIPDDFIIWNGMILDIGQNTLLGYKNVIAKSKMIIWSGPLGKIETPEFARGSEAIARAIAESGAFSIIGGGDTLAVIGKLNLKDKFGYVSTGGGAMLEFLAGKTLPGLKALNNE